MLCLSLEWNAEHPVIWPEKYFRYLIKHSYIFVLCLFQSIYRPGLRSKLIHSLIYLGPIHQFVVWIFLHFLQKEVIFLHNLFNTKCVTVMRQLYYKPLISATVAVLTLKT